MVYAYVMHLLPVQKVAAHLQRGERARRLQEMVLRRGVIVKDEGEVAREQAVTTRQRAQTHAR